MKAVFMVEREYIAVVLAGGIGSRLRPLTSNLPKPLVPVANWTMLDYNLFLLKNAGIKKAIIVVKYLGEKIREHVKRNYQKYDMEIIIPECDPLDTADAVRKVAGYINGPFIVTMADIITSLNLKELLEFHEKKGGTATISLKSIDQPGSFGVILLSAKSEILLFLGKPVPKELYITTLAFSRRETVHLESNLVNTGIYVFEQALLDHLNDFDDLMDFGKHVFPFLLTRNDKIYGYTQETGSEYYWMDCGTPRKYLWANNDVLRRWSWPYLAKGKETSRDLWTGDGVTVSPAAKIIPPACIGKKTVIGENSNIGTLTVIGEKCKIGKDVNITKTVIWANVTIEDGCDIRGSIICDGAVVKSGTKLIDCVVKSNAVVNKCNERIS
ncbi:MAG: sugar phosphate nucleotidyltransferase [Candidatus Hodarchaeales archaeon]